MPPLYALEPGDTAVVAVPGSTDPEIVAFLDTLGLRPGVRVEVKEKHPFDGPLVLRVDGKDRTLGATVANQVSSRNPPKHPEEQTMTHVLAAEGGYQAFTLHGGEWAILIASALTALLALVVGFFLMRGVLAAGRGHAEDEGDRARRSRRARWRTSSGSSRRSASS